MKKLVLVIAAVIFSLAVVGCSVTKTESYTDADGNTTTTTTVKDSSGTQTTTETTDANGQVIEEEAEPAIEAELIKATLIFVNDCGVDISEMYFGIDCAATDEWGEEVLGDDAPLKDQEQITFENAFTYSDDYPFWDFLIVDENGDGLSFAGINVTTAENPEEIAIVVTRDDDGEIVVSVE